MPFPVAERRLVVRASYYPSGTESQPARCMLCMKPLGGSFHFTCHVCGAEYCYVHMPERCGHRRERNPFVLPQVGSG